MRNLCINVLFIYGVLLITIDYARAIDNTADINWNGFFTIGAGKLSTDKLKNRRDYDENISFKTDTNFGLQGVTEINNKVNFTVQFLGRSGNEDFNVGIEWAYVTYTAGDRYNIRAGRLRSPYYNYSDFLDVGYAYHWVTPPDAVYDTIPFSSIDGVDFIYKKSLGDIDAQVQLIFGRQTRTAELYGNPISADVVDFFGYNATFSYRSLELRLAHQVADLSLQSKELTELSNTWLAIQSPLNEIGNQLLVEERNTTFSGLGISVDFFPYFLVSEYTILDIERSFIFGYDSWYSSLGFTHHKFIFHVTYEEYETNPMNVTAGLPRGTSLDPLISLTQELEEGYLLKEHTIKLGVRYDIAARSAFKFDISHVETKLVCASLFQIAFSQIF